MRIARGVVFIACLGVLLAGVAAAVGAPAAHATAQKLLTGSASPVPPTLGPWIEITGLERCGCGEGGIVFDYYWSSIPAGSIGDIRVIVNGVVYEDTLSSPVPPGGSSGASSWAVHNENSGGTATGTWPLPSGQPVQIILTVTDPGGRIVAGWKSVLDSCSGTCAFSSSALYDVYYPVPTATAFGLAALAALLLVVGVFFLLRGRAS